MMELIALRKVVRSKYHRNDGLFALIEADLGEEYINAN